MSTHPYPRTSQPARTPSCTRGPSRNLVLPGSDAIAANNCASAYEQTAIRAHSAPNGRVPQRRDAANPDAHALVTRIGSFIKYVREGEHALAHFLAADASKHTKKGGRGPPFSATRYATATVYALTSASAATTAPAAPASNNPRCCNYARNGGYIRQSYRVRYGNRNCSTSKRSPASLTSP